VAGAGEAAAGSVAGNEEAAAGTVVGANKVTLGKAALAGVPTAPPFVPAAFETGPQQAGGADSKRAGRTFACPAQKRYGQKVCDVLCPLKGTASQSTHTPLGHVTLCPPRPGGRRCYSAKSKMQDISSRIHIAVEHETAGRTVVNPNG
jgi:hypothetical protein